MGGNSNLKQRWTHVSWHFAMDVFLFIAAFGAGIVVRFLGEKNLLNNALVFYYPSIVVGALVFASACYIFGLYSPQLFKQSLFTRSLVLMLNLSLALLLMTVMFYLNYSSRVGRGAMVLSTIIAYLALLGHHIQILRCMRAFKERVVLLVTCEFDEMETHLFDEFWGNHLELAGIIHSGNYVPKGTKQILGSADHLFDIVQKERVDRVLCTNKGFSDPALYQQFCRLRYSGETVMPLINLCEDVYQLVPLELMSPEWLMNASASPHMLYIKKTKRGFDVATSLLGLLFLGPVLLMAMLAVKLTSPGPLFYRQVRAGRFGRLFRMIKLRTMRTDAEKNGAVWSRSDDDRVTPVGKILRKYRIDEIPQLINVLRGEMSFVGPRPERPEFIDELARQIPYYKERLMVQPGITGWAQVNYPYGSSVQDARRKLEFDLYYLKHMSVFLDLFILVDTIRIVLKGGLDDKHKNRLPQYLSGSTSSATDCIPSSQEGDPPAGNPSFQAISK